MTKQWQAEPLAPGLDGYADWNHGDGKEYYPIKDHPSEGNTELTNWFHVLLRLDAGMPLNAVSDLSDKLRFQPFTRNPPKGLDKSTYVAALASNKFVQELTKGGGFPPHISKMNLGLLFGAPSKCDDQPCGANNCEPNNPQIREAVPGMVVIGIIDDGIAFGHERFCRKNGKTRVEYAWIQDGACRDQDGACEKSKSPVTYGREYQKFGAAQTGGIDNLLKECAFNGTVDEDAFYRRIGLTDHARSGHKSVAWRAAHGTHVLDLACGYDPEEDRRDRPIVCVQLPTLATADTSGTGLQPNVLDGIWYILDRADRIARQHGVEHLPVLINFSYGNIAGPHDGMSMLEAAIDEILVNRRRATGQPHEIVMPSGNGHLSQTRAQISFDEKYPSAGASAALNWHVFPDDKTSSFMEIWLPCSDAAPGSSRIEVRVEPPWGEASAPLSEETSGTGVKWMPFAGKPALCKMTYEFVESLTGNEETASGRGRFVIALPPTAFQDTGNELAPPGVWTITLTNFLLEKEEIVEAWVQRDDTPFNFFPRGRQSYFDEDCYERVHPVTGREIEDDSGQTKRCHIRRAGTMSAVATGGEVVVVGGFLGKERTAAKYSAGGPEVHGNRNWTTREGPDALTVSDDSRVHRGVLAAGSRSGSAVALPGTSVAAPQIVRQIARAISEANSKEHTFPGGRAYIQQLANAKDPQDPCDPTQPKPERGGHGRIELSSNYLLRYWT